MLVSPGSDRPEKYHTAAKHGSAEGPRRCECGAAPRWLILVLVLLHVACAGRLEKNPSDSLQKLGGHNDELHVSVQQQATKLDQNRQIVQAQVCAELPDLTGGRGYHQSQGGANAAAVAPRFDEGTPGGSLMMLDTAAATAGRWWPSHQIDVTVSYNPWRRIGQLMTLCSK